MVYTSDSILVPFQRLKRLFRMLDGRYQEPGY